MADANRLMALSMVPPLAEEVASQIEAGSAGGVESVNGQTGAVVLDASDVGALPDTYSAPVVSVNGDTGAVVLAAADVGAATAAQGSLADTAVQPGDLSAVATSGAYADLTGTPTLGDLAALNTVAAAQIDSNAVTNVKVAAAAAIARSKLAATGVAAVASADAADSGDWTADGAAVVALLNECKAQLNALIAAA